jgi:hypothetical protein
MDLLALDKVWMIVRNENGQRPEVIYGAPATNIRQAWNNVIEPEIMGTGVTRAWLQARGFRAKKVMICI